MQNRTPPQPLDVLKALLPATLALIGVGVFNGVATLELRTRYQTAADILVWASMAGIVVSIAAAVYPFALEAPLKGIARRIRAGLSSRLERRQMSEWLAHWAELSALMVDATSKKDGPSNDWWKLAEPRYHDLRSWLIEHESWVPAGALHTVLATLDAQWERLTTLEANLRHHGFFSLFRSEDLIFQAYGVIHRESNVGQGQHGHHPEHTFNGIWDGMNRYSVSRGWGSIGEWRSFPRVPLHPEPDMAAEEQVVASVSGRSANLRPP